MKRILLILSAVALVAACSKEKPGTEEPGGRFAFTAGFFDASDGTKVFLDHDYYNTQLNVLWEQGDGVSIFDGQTAARFESDRAGVSTSLYAEVDAGFDKEASHYHALFPYDEGARFEEVNGVQYVTTLLPAEQRAQRGSFSAHVAVASCTQDDRNFVFRNVTAVFKATITSDRVRRLVFSGKSGETVAGSIKVSMSDASYTLVGDGSETVIVLPPEGLEAFEPGRYFFTVLPQIFKSGFTVTIEMTDGTSEVRDPGITDALIGRSTLTIGSAIGIEGSGVFGDPYRIKNKYDLESLATIVADDVIPYGTTTYISIDNDIDFRGMTSWIPVNNSRDENQIAKLDIEGNGSVISSFAPQDFADGIGVDPKDPMERNQPSLLGILYGEVRNLTIEQANILAGTSTAGILAGWAGYKGKPAVIENVHVSGSVSGKKVVGGLAGSAYDATFRNCSAAVDVNASGEHAGGLVGRFHEDVSFENCHVQGTVRGTSGVGGLLGGNETVSSTEVLVDRCSATCNVSGIYQVGGLVGHTKSPTHITSSWAKGNVTATARENSFMPGKQVGGILGALAGGAAGEIDGCWYGGGTISADGSLIGGVLGLNTGTATISDCHVEASSIVNTGAYHEANPDVNYDMFGVGGILGGSRGSGVSISNCFVDEGTISSRACGSMTSYPDDWAAWTSSVAGETGGFKGGAVGGIAGYIAEPKASVSIAYNTCWLSEINCTRSSVYDAPCAPIVGCLSSAIGSMPNNRYYQDQTGENCLVIQDEYTDYAPRSPKSVTAAADRNNVINALSGGERANQYCLYNKPVDNTNNSPSTTAKTWGWNSALWNLDGFKPVLKIRPADE